ncbi:DUF5333 domain-containing protein [Flavimaricola marinus]|uniref:DUF5333 domain-containing protein n=1 Tax=Flavimaricola marinus TaxID=1819565 RepID=A0A238LEE9_9RHOB|nr:DUF5333 domain-containing protein [Flavimaricola marinus]SMY07794.1 hypothetical protein LOM8899_01934 [Flavimaricola marinus]
MSLKRNLIHSLLLITGFVIVAGATAAKPGLNNEARITNGLIDTAIAYEIGRKCDSLEPRIIQGINFLYELRSHAQSLGYTSAEIDSYIENDAEKDRLEAIARDRLRALGGVEGEWETYCEVGRAQIAAGTQIGRLLR